jgi:hypothetical protein
MIRLKKQLKQLQESQANVNQVHGSLDYLYKPSTPAGSGVGGQWQQRS